MTNISTRALACMAAALFTSAAMAVPGDTCEDPLYVTLPDDLAKGAWFTSDTTCGRVNDYTETCLGSYDGGEDIIYEITVTVAGDYTFFVVPAGTWTGVALANDCPPTDCIIASTVSSGNHEFCVPLAVGTYYLMIDTWPTPDCTAFDLTITDDPCARGACCFPDGSCQPDMTPDECDAAGGNYWGDDTVCDPNPCPQPLENESCATAEVIPSVPVTIYFDNDNATADDPQGSCHYPGPPALMMNDAWYCYTPAEDCYLVMDVDPDYGAGYDAVMAAYMGPDCGNLTEIYCADDPEPYHFEVAATAGTTYWFQIGDYGTTEGGGLTELVLDCQPGAPEGACCMPDGTCIPDQTAEECDVLGGEYWGNDTVCDPNPCPVTNPGDVCSNPLVVTLPDDLVRASWTTSDTTCGRVDDYEDTCLGYYDGGEDIIYEVIVTAAGDYTFTVNPGTFTYTGMGLGAECPPMTCIGLSTSSSAAPHGFCVTLDVGTYYLMLDSWPLPECYAFDLTITDDPCPEPPENDECANAEAIGDVTDYAFDTTLASGSGGSPVIYNDIWYCYTASCTGLAHVDLCGTTFDTKLRVYDTCSCDPFGTELAYNDDSCGLQSMVEFMVVEGNEYLIQAGGYGSTSNGAGDITIYCSDSGACCVPDARGCVNDLTEAECDALGGTYYYGEDCDDPCFYCFYGPVMIECPPDSMFSQIAETSGWTAGTSDAAPGYKRWESYTVEAEICDIHFWAFNLTFDGSWADNPCERPMTLEIGFYPDDGTGQPDTVNAQCFYTLALDPTPVELISASYMLWQYDTDLDPCCDLLQGYVSVQGISVTDPDAWFMWMSGVGADSISWLWDPAVGLALDDFDLSLCLTPGAACPASDLNDDCCVNVSDLLILLGNWGTNGAGAELCEPYDVVNVSDLLFLLGEWGQGSGCP